ncbi:histidine--tRNA ligase [Nocardioides baekrokdamisoli]|uniref:Histidine--tRNA ligase n=1 Tax=Nocardioides baekrokdamisoli TaxID=1804624 RepID=A0A3G9IJT4_9ACTN|nr:histidine--tRNA ligase [Nocardioides baekrokdamisoli]BBH16325.1 histidine--tRNA ligase [Nocardioides baekrokdamisoli]
MAKPTPLSGFPEFLPAERFVEQEVVATLARTFELHGFANLETRAVEPMDQLLAKGETSKEVYVLKRLQDTGDGDAGMGLHFDLTVPFARFVLENSGKLDFPFRRYQIQKVWRGERPQAGRFREFTQADIDVVGRDTLGFHHDVEVARVMAEALGRLEFLPGFRIQVNNRKLIQGFYLGLGASDPMKVMQLVDKLDKLPAEKLASLLQSDAGLSADQADQTLALAQICSGDTSFVEAVRALGVTHDLLDEGLAELAAVVDGCASITDDRVRVVADLSIARGLDYYTGTVFETRLDGFESLGSICSGGRYDSLASDGRTTYPGVGISFGVSRALVPLLQQGVVRASRSVPSAVLVALTSDDGRAEAEAVAQQLRTNGTPTEVAPKADKFGKQIAYADKRGIPYVLFLNENGPEIKDIRSGEQVPIDPATWVPAAADLRPTITQNDALPISKDQK